MTRNKRFRPLRRGGAAVEFALVAPLFFLLVFGSIEFGRAMMALQALEESAREGCRVAIMDGNTNDNAKDAVTAFLLAAGMADHTTTFSPTTPADACQWDPISVIVTVPYTDISWLPAPWFLDGITLKGTCTLPREGNPCD